MVNTSYLTNAVEQWVRAELERQYGMPFSKQFLELQSGGLHEFDAVSSNARQVCSIKTASGKTSGGKAPAGKIMACIAELYFLSLVEAPQRSLILTTPAFYELFMKRMHKKLAPGVTIELLALPSEVQQEVERVQGAASAEMLGLPPEARP